MKRYLGIDIGGTEIKYGVYTVEGTELSSGKVPTKKETVEEFINLLGDIIDKHSDVDGIGVSMPGFVNVNTGEIVDPGAIQPLRGHNLKELIKERTGKDVEVENDANCVALAEKWIGNGQKYENFLAMTIGTGIGGGVVLNNKLFRGNGFMAGEFGYIKVDGLVGASDAASTFALVRDVAEVKGIQKRELDGKKIFKMIEDGDKEVIKVYDNWIEKLAKTVFNLVFSLNPDAFLIGGGVSVQPRVLQDVKRKLEELDDRILNFVDVDTCKFNNDSGKIGAIYNHLDRQGII